MSRAYAFHNPDGLYFVTFTTISWIDVFTRDIYRKILIESIAFCQKEKGLELYAWCLMTNHIHLIIKAKEGFTLSGILRDLKKHTSRKITEAILNNPSESRREWMISMFKSSGAQNPNNKFYQFWQQDNRPIELWSNMVIDQKVEYIHNNPVKAGFVSSPEHWKYSSAVDFSGDKGLLDLEVL